MKISDRTAQRDFGISTFHSRMSNGESRFRLKKVDGTAYIRTEAASGGWQESHFHEHVYETYIVQEGWMAFAELIDMEVRVRIFKTNEIVTTNCNIVHNVYLTEGAVIHTVKHGLGIADDRLVNSETEAFDLVTHAMKSESIILSSAITESKNSIYTDEYRHFDNLIWQVPAWSTAIFALSIQPIFSAINSSKSHEIIAAGILSIFSSLALACFSFVMLRFRAHQISMKKYSKTPKWKSASTITQSLVTIESCVLLTIALNVFQFNATISTFFGIFVSFCAIFLGEKFVENGRPGRSKPK